MQRLMMMHLNFLADMSGGDARHALNAVELGYLDNRQAARWKDPYYACMLHQECIQKRAGAVMTKTGTTITIPSLLLLKVCGDLIRMQRSIIWQGCCMREKSVTFIARRIMICASEDVGNADPMALTVAVAAAQAVERIGMPESQIILIPGGDLCGICTKEQCGRECDFCCD